MYTVFHHLSSVGPKQLHSQHTEDVTTKQALPCVKDEHVKHVKNTIVFKKIWQNFVLRSFASENLISKQFWKEGERRVKKQSP